MKTMIVYFSFTAGNTKRIAEKIQSVIGGDLIRLETVVPYPTDYEAAVSQGQDEVNKGFKPKLKPLGVNIREYDPLLELRHGGTRWLRLYFHSFRKMILQESFLFLT